MKNLMITLVILGAIFVPETSDAQRHQSELNLRIFDNSFFSVIFDRKIYDSPTTNFQLSNITPGMHRLIVKQRYGGRNGALRTIYDGSIQIPANSVVNAHINKFNRLDVRTVAIDRHYYSDNSYNRYYNKPLLDFPRLQHSINNASFENDKRMIAENAISSHQVKANQIYRILMMFSFESTKLKIAKFAYRHCIDKHNYYVVNDAFSFSSSIRDLNNFIGNFRSDYYDDDWSERNEYNNNGNNNNNNHRK